jgi:hypothetical protein
MTEGSRPNLEALTLGRTVVQFDGEGLTTTFIPGASPVPARAHLEGELHTKDQERIYRERAQAHGYEDVHEFSRDHEVLHSLLALWVGMSSSPALEWVAHGCPNIDPDARALHGAEESVVLALQAYMKRAGLSVIQVAKRFGPGD